MTAIILHFCQHIDQVLRLYRRNRFSRRRCLRNQLLPVLAWASAVWALDGALTTTFRRSPWHGSTPTLSGRPHMFWWIPSMRCRLLIAAPHAKNPRNRQICDLLLGLSSPPHYLEAGFRLGGRRLVHPHPLFPRSASPTRSGTLKSASKRVFFDHIFRALPRTAAASYHSFACHSLRMYAQKGLWLAFMRTNSMKTFLKAAYNGTICRARDPSRIFEYSDIRIILGEYEYEFLKSNIRIV